jgi:exodeoxyribonuclease VII large subunit
LVEARWSQDLWIGGSITKLYRSPAGHTYFDLRGTDAAIKVFDRDGRVGCQAEELADGLDVAVAGRLDLFNGLLTLNARSILVGGESLAHQRYRRLRALLESEGFFAVTRKRHLVPWPKRIGLVTSRDGAAVDDIRSTLERRWPYCEILLSFCRVQGPPAEASLVAALARLGEIHQTLPLDVIIVARGGGSAIDLEAFNAETVARAIFRSPAPVVAAIGHASDLTLADEVADASVVTPTAAAERVTPDRAHVTLYVNDISIRLHATITRIWHHRQDELTNLVERLTSRRPAHLLDDRTYQVGQLAAHLRERIARQQARAEGRFAAVQDRLPNIAGNYLARHARHLDGLSLRLPRRHPGFRLEGAEGHVIQLHVRATTLLEHKLFNAESQLTLREAELRLVNPRAVLRRGYAVVRAEDGTPVVSAARALAGAILRVDWIDGTRELIVRGDRHHNPD